MKKLLFLLLLVASPALAQPLRELPPEPPTPVEAGKTFAQGGNDKLLISVTAVGFPNSLQYVKAESSLPGVKHFDVMIFTGGNFVEAVETKNKGEFVFTGPVGRYTIRVSAFDPELGFISRTQTMEIRGGTEPIGPVNPTDPVTPPIPVDPGSPSTGPPPEGYTGLGPLVYEVLVKDRPDIKATKQLASNFEWAATVKGVELLAIINELKKRNEGVYTATPGLKSFKDAWVEHVNRQITHGVLLPDITEHQRAYAETAAGIRAAYGK